MWDPEARKVCRSQDVIFLPLTNRVEFEEFTRNEIEINIEWNLQQRTGKYRTEQLSNESNESSNTESIESDDSENVNNGNSNLQSKRGRGCPKKIKTGGRGRPRKAYPTATPASATDEAEREIEESLSEGYHSANII